jgi:hypothetical protein
MFRAVHTTKNLYGNVRTPNRPDCLHLQGQTSKNQNKQRICGTTLPQLSIQFIPNHFYFYSVISLFASSTCCCVKYTPFDATAWIRSKKKSNEFFFLFSFKINLQKSFCQAEERRTANSNKNTQGNSILGRNFFKNNFYSLKQKKRVSHNCAILYFIDFTLLIDHQ